MDVLSFLGPLPPAVLVTYLFAKWYVGKTINGIREDIREIKSRIMRLEDKIGDIDEIKGELKVIHELVMKILNSGRK